LVVRQSFAEEQEEPVVEKRAWPGDRLARWRDVVGILSSLSIILGVAISVTQLIGFVENSKRASVTLRLSALQQVKDFLARDEEVRRLAQQFLAEKLPAIQANVGDRIKRYGSGEAFYLSPEMKDFATVHYHYEQMGALVKLGYVEFPLIFEIITYPDSYMERVEPLRASIAQNWKGPGRPLPDFGSNIQYLQKCYEASRKDYSTIPACPK
jgi:hypothetical protein